MMGLIVAASRPFKNKFLCSIVSGDCHGHGAVNEDFFKRLIMNAPLCGQFKISPPVAIFYCAPIFADQTIHSYKVPIEYHEPV